MSLSSNDAALSFTVFALFVAVIVADEHCHFLIELNECRSCCPSANSDSGRFCGVHS